MQAYGKRAIPVLRWLRRLAERTGKRIPVRLVKGAYWDSEIKWAQERALADYPVFTRKLHTDVSYLACVRLLLSDPKAFYPQFATHNAHTVAAAHVAGGPAAFEFQRLHGMGEALYDEVVGEGDSISRPCRIYAPVGGHEDLLAYLVRRLLENGANTSFVNRLADDEAPVAEIIRDPVETAEARTRRHGRAAARLRAPARHLSARAQGSERPGADRAVGARRRWSRRCGERSTTSSRPARSSAATPAAGGDAASLVTCPHDRRERIGTVRVTTPAQADAAIERAVEGRARLGQAGRRSAAPQSWTRPPISSSATGRA